MSCISIFWMPCQSPFEQCKIDKWNNFAISVSLISFIPNRHRSAKRIFIFQDDNVHFIELRTSPIFQLYIFVVVFLCTFLSICVHRIKWIQGAEHIAHTTHCNIRHERINVRKEDYPRPIWLDSPVLQFGSEDWKRGIVGWSAKKWKLLLFYFGNGYIRSDNNAPNLNGDGCKEKNQEQEREGDDDEADRWHTSVPRAPLASCLHPTTTFQCVPHKNLLNSIYPFAHIFLPFFGLFRSDFFLVPYQCGLLQPVLLALIFRPFDLYYLLLIMWSCAITSSHLSAAMFFLFLSSFISILYDGCGWCSRSAPM